MIFNFYEDPFQIQNLLMYPTKENSTYSTRRSYSLEVHLSHESFGYDTMQCIILLSNYILQVCQYCEQ